MKTCKIEGCIKKYHAKGYCQSHFNKSPKRKAYLKEYYKTPKHKAYRKAYLKEYYKTPKHKAYLKEYYKTPKFKALHKAHSLKQTEKRALTKRISTLKHRIDTLTKAKYPIPIPLQSKYDCFCRLYELHFIEGKEGIPACIIGGLVKKADLPLDGEKT